MGNKQIVDSSVSYTKEELMEQQHKKMVREKIVARTRSAVVRSQLVEAYKILESIRFDFVGDTAFRDKITTAKGAIEWAIDDFLMSDGYWEKRIDDIQKLTPEEFVEQYTETDVVKSPNAKISQ